MILLFLAQNVAEEEPVLEVWALPFSCLFSPVLLVIYSSYDFFAGIFFKQFVHFERLSFTKSN